MGQGQNLHLLTSFEQSGAHSKMLHWAEYDENHFYLIWAFFSLLSEVTPQHVTILLHEKDINYMYTCSSHVQYLSLFGNYWKIKWATDLHYHSVHK